jgi:hypothetical protein
MISIDYFDADVSRWVAGPALNAKLQTCGVGVKETQVKIRQ